MEETNKSVLQLAKQTEKVFRLPQGCFLLFLFFHLYKIGWFEMEIVLLN